MKKDSIGNRMKYNYEKRGDHKLIRRIPVIIRLDGKAFHTLTRKHCKDKFDEHFYISMLESVKSLFDKIQGLKCAYFQSDEVSLLLTDFDSFETEAWFDYKLSKIESISAAMMSVIFTKNFGHEAFFDSRARNYPKEEVNNYFVWRQQDCRRNSVQVLAQKYFSHKELHKKNTKDSISMLLDKGINYYNLDNKFKNGTFVYRDFDNVINHSSGIIFKDNKFIDKSYLKFSSRSEVYDKNGEKIKLGQNVLVHQDDKVSEAQVFEIFYDRCTLANDGCWIYIYRSGGLEGMPSYLLEVIK